MALPKLNNSPKYEMIIPSKNQTVRFRPYLVKEEKVLLMAFESQDTTQAMKAIIDTILVCVDDNITGEELTTFDVEYMFTQIRSKSVGETSEIKVKCENCEHMNEQTIDLSKVEVVKTDVDTTISLTDSISIEMRYPTYDAFVRHYKDGMTESEFGFLMLQDCIVSIMTEDEQFLVSDVSQKELNEFIESMTNQQFEKVGNFLKDVPTMSKDIEFTCSECGHENKTKLEGLQDFF